MQIRIFACVEGSPSLWEIDDPTVFSDLGAAYDSVRTTNPVDFGPARGYGRLREVVQWVSLFGSASLSLTPVADGELLTDQRYDEAISVLGGIEQRIEAPVAAAGARFGVEIRLRNCTALTELGEADLTYVRRRSLTGSPP
jgi:hypothetical protein